MTIQLQPPRTRGARRTTSTITTVTLSCAVLLLVLIERPLLVESNAFGNPFGLNPSTIVGELASAFADPEFVDSLLDSGSAGDGETSSADDVECVAQFDASLASLVKGDLWALKMYDAWGKLPSGILSGNSYELGDFDACLQVRAANLSSNAVITSHYPTSNPPNDLHGQYCLAQLTLALNQSSSSSISSSNVQQPIIRTLPDPIKTKGLVSPPQLNPNARGIIIPGQQQQQQQGAATLSFMVALCVPSVCRPAMVGRVFAQLALRLKLSVVASVTEKMCESGDDGADMSAEGNAFDAIDWAAVAIFSSVAIAMLLSTIYDLYKTYHSKTARSPLLIAFSVYTNGQKLFRTSVPPSNQHQATITSTAKPVDATTTTAPAQKHQPNTTHFDCLNGIRALSIIWVVFGHTYMLLAIGPLINTANILDWVEQPFSMMLLSATVSVDTFFMMSGLLVTWSLLRYLDARNGRLPLGWLYLHRYLRLTPALAAAVLMCVSLLRRLGDGPLWRLFMDVADGPCRRWWWTTLLYAQNYANPQEMCMSHSWYLSVDMQLYVLAPVLVWPLWWLTRRVGGVGGVVGVGEGRRGRWLVESLPFVVPTALMLASMATVFGLLVAGGFSSRMSTFLLGGRRMELVYYPTHCRMGAWLVGLMLGFVLHARRGHTVIIARHWLVIGWTLCLSTLVGVIAANYPLQSTHYTDSPIGGAAYEALSRPAWSLAVAFLVYACASGYGGPVNWLLSLPEWRPLARMSYAIYIVHLPVMLVLLAQIRVARYFSDTSAIEMFWGQLGVTLTVAVLWTLAFESPVLALEKVLLGGGGGSGSGNGGGADVNNGERNRAERHCGREAGVGEDSTDSMASQGECDDVDGRRQQHQQRRSRLAGDYGVVGASSVGSSQEDLVRPGRPMTIVTVS